MRDALPLADRIPPRGTNDPDEILGLFLDWVASTGLTLYPAQEEALLEIMAGKHVILGTPTGSGKSLVALGLHFKAACEGRVSVYTSPIKALASEKFSGAEIEEAINSALYDAFYARKQLTTDQILNAISQTVPLAKTMEEQIGSLREWAEGRARNASVPRMMQATES